jgi:hypothetical protein
MQNMLAGCPTCGFITPFEYVGKQQYPSIVAQRLGIPDSVHLWNCLHCRTTLSENELVTLTTENRLTLREEHEAFIE